MIDGEGKIFHIINKDADSDGIPDFADRKIELSGEAVSPFTPVRVQVPTD